jgi:hypothetical protein
MKRLLIIALITMFIAATSFFAIADGEVCGCGCGQPVIEGTTNCGCGWTP